MTNLRIPTKYYFLFAVLISFHNLPSEILGYLRSIPVEMEVRDIRAQYYSSHRKQRSLFFNDNGSILNQIELVGEDKDGTQYSTSFYSRVCTGETDPLKCPELERKIGERGIMYCDPANSTFCRSNSYIDRFDRTVAGLFIFLAFSIPVLYSWTKSKYLPKSLKASQLPS
jgi:hypothetical protein